MKKQKRIYETPTAAAVDVKMQGMLCWSQKSLMLLDQVLDGQTITQKDNFGDTWQWDQ